MKKHYTKHNTTSDAARDERRAEAKKTVEESITTLLEEIKAGKTEHYVQWLQFASQFHKYSTANMWLIMGQMQRRGLYASHIASYKAWQDMGYQVKKGEKALFVWAPRPYTKEVEDKKTHEKEEKSFTGFVLVPVFDACQIAQGADENGNPYKPMQSYFTPLPSDEQARNLYHVARQIATSEGFTCTEEERTDGIEGWSRNKEIAVKAGKDDLSTLATFIHEFAHGLLHWDGITRSKQQKECEAESIAYIVTSHFGMTYPYTSDYLLMYNATAEVLTAHLTRIRDTAHSLIEKIEKALHTKEEEIAA
jgi:hypothetical protein